MNIKFIYPVTYDEYTGVWNICSGGFIYTTLGDYYDSCNDGKIDIHKDLNGETTCEDCLQQQ